MPSQVARIQPYAGSSAIAIVRSAARISTGTSAAGTYAGSKRCSARADARANSAPPSFDGAGRCIRSLYAQSVTRPALDSADAVRGPRTAPRRQTGNRDRQNPGSAPPLSCPQAGGLTTRQASLDAADRSVAPPTGLSTLGFDPARYQTEPPACYRAFWQLPGRDSHPPATTSLCSDQVNLMAPPPKRWAHVALPAKCDTAPDVGGACSAWVYGQTVLWPRQALYSKHSLP
jgi:hypothetical protein